MVLFFHVCFHLQHTNKHRTPPPLKRSIRMVVMVVVVLVVVTTISLFVCFLYAHKSHRLSTSVSAAPSAITSMEFWLHNNNRQQLLAVADDSGNLHILEIPRSLWRPDNNEELIMSSFFQREVLAPNLNPNPAGFFFLFIWNACPPHDTT
jgi:hypothetical protein